MPSVAFPLTEAARIFGSSPALVTPDASYSYSELDAKVAGMASDLKRSGISVGSRVGIRMPGCTEYVILLWACWRAGLVTCPFDTRLPEGTLFERADDTGCRVVLAAGCAIADFIADHLSSSTAGSVGSHPRNDEPPTSMAAIISTSGSSGAQKAAVLSVESLYYSALGSNENIPFGPGDRWLLSLPLYHVGGLGILWRAAISGGAVVIPEQGQSLTDAIERFGATHLSLVATQLRRLVDEIEHGRRLPPLKAVLLGGSAIPPTLLDRAHGLGLPVCTSYGLTEMCSQVTTTRPGETKEKLHTSGRVLAYRELSIAPDGEILVRGNTLFSGYWSDGEIVPARDDHGWFPTGDLGALDSAGYLTVFGRKDNLFISGGENIQPEEIERALELNESVARAVVVPVPHPEWGERPVAFVEMAGARPFEPHALASYLRERLPRFKVPDHFLPWPDDQPAGMKIDRQYLKRLATSLTKPTT